MVFQDRWFQVSQDKFPSSKLHVVFLCYSQNIDYYIIIFVGSPIKDKNILNYSDYTA